MPYGALREAAVAASISCPAWQQLLREQLQQDYFMHLEERVDQARQTATVYPPQAQVFAAFEHTSLAHTKVVILGQDPYHQPGQAHGLAFSVPEGVKVPPSLRNIYKAIAHDAPGFVAPEHGNLKAWAAQGVLLLNTVLTVEHSKAHAHARWGWETFTDAVMARLNAHPEPIVFLLWGKHAQQKGQQITNPQHAVLESVHPSPLSAHRGFITCGHFAEANRVLSAKGRQTIEWQAIQRPSTTQKQQRQQKLAL